MKRGYILLILAFLLFSAGDILAQCAMCKAVAETGQNDGISVSGGINNAIYYLMVLPYILLILFFRKRIFGFLKELRALWK